MVFGNVFLFFGIISVLCIYLLQDRILYKTLSHLPERYPQNNTFSLRRPSNYENMLYEDLTLRTADDVHLKGWFIYPNDTSDSSNFKSGQKPTFVYLHENTGNIGIRMPFYYSLVSKLDVNVLVMAYRGYSNSNGTASELGLKVDGRTILKYLEDPSRLSPKISKHINPRLIYLYGRGIGAGVAMHMAETNPGIIRGLILENAFTSISDVVDYQFNIIKHFKQYLVTNYWNNAEIAEKLPMPILYIAGSKDELVPEDHTRKLHALSKKAAFTELYVVDGAGHTDCYSFGGNTYISKLKAFVDKTVVKYEPDSFDEWAAGKRFDKKSDLLEQESEEASKVKITTTRLPPGALEKIQEKHKQGKKKVAGTIGYKGDYPEIKNDENLSEDE